MLQGRSVVCQLPGVSGASCSGLGSQYTRRTESTPEEYYGLIDPETADLWPYVEQYLADMAQDQGYDNE